MKDLGELHYCLGVCVEWDRDQKCVLLHQNQYVLSLIEKYGMTEAKIVSTPTDPSVKLEKDDGISKE